jgi:hypothetical protein
MFESQEALWSSTSWISDQNLSSWRLDKAYKNRRASTDTCFWLPLNSPYGCELCDVPFAKEMEEARDNVHLKLDHFNVHFPGCEKMFELRWSDISRETQHTENPERFAPAEGCDMTFPSMSNMTSCQEGPWGERPYECTWEGCDKKFSSSTDQQAYRLCTSWIKTIQMWVWRLWRSIHKDTDLAKHIRTVHENIKDFVYVGWVR